MKLPIIVQRKLTRIVATIMLAREPDFIIGDDYLLRWWVIPRNRFFNIYLHHIRTSDDDRALHDHPWSNCSVMVGGGYFENTVDAGGIRQRIWRGAGEVKFRSAANAHRLEIKPDGFATTFFITGPKFRNWGFHCPDEGWVPWEQFCDARDPSKLGKGCN